MGEFEIELLSKEETIDFAQIVGQPMTVRLHLPDDEERRFSGVVSRFAHVGTHGNFQLYRATVRPWLWMLSLKSDCRIFQEMTAIDIIKEVLREHNIKFNEALTRSYRSRVYCVQYRETDFNFISRLMEEEGIYYFFEHEQDNQNLVLADSSIAHGPTPGYEEVPYYPKADAADARERDHVDTWSFSQSLESGACLLQDFNYERPAANLQAKLVSQNPLANKDLEIYDYPGVFDSTSEGEEYVRIRLEERYARQSLARGAGNVRGLAPGYTFSLTNFAQEGEYLVVNARYELKSDDYETALGGATSKELFRCSFSAVESQRPFRSVRLARKPRMQGPQTAIVVGKSGEEIWTDASARIKLQFHWDRQGRSDESSSCWVRVAQLWAGGGFGGVYIPRMGHEVVVEFLEGDPDRPLVTGCVYNGANKPPHAQPGTQSGIMSRSTKGGGAGNFNQLRFEDNKGSEEVFLQAEKDLNVTVKNNASYRIGNDETHSVGNDETHTVGNNESHCVGNDREKTVGNNETTVVGANRTETVGSDEVITIGHSRTENVGGNDTITVGGSHSQTVTMTATESVGLAKTVNVGAIYSEQVGASRSSTVAGSLSFNAGGAGSLSCGKSVSITTAGPMSTSSGKTTTISSTQDMTLSSSATIIVSAKDDLAISGDAKGVVRIKDELTIQCGKASITLKKNGDISLNGKTISVKGSGDVTLKGKKIKAN